MYPLLPGYSDRGYGEGGGLRSYGTLSLTVTSPVQSFTEPLTLGEATTHLNLPARDPQDKDEEAMISGFISGARSAAELLQGRDLVAKQYDLALDYFPCVFGGLELRAPLVSVDLVRYRDSAGDYTTLEEGTDYIVDLARALILPVYGKSWPSFTPWPSSAVLVRFTSGLEATDVFWSNAGARVKIGMKYLISAWFNGRLPFETLGSIQEYPYAVTMLLSAGARNRVR